MVEARSYTRKNYKKNEPHADYKLFYEWYRRVPIPSKTLGFALAQSMVLQLVEVLVRSLKVGYCVFPARKSFYKWQQRVPIPAKSLKIM